MKNSLPKILITGAQGQLGQALTHHALAQEYSIQACSRTDMNIVHLDDVQNKLIEYQPDLIINTAAYTAVDKAETETEAALQTNYMGARHLAMVCEAHHIPLIHLSTDYVFDGKQTHPYHEQDETHPLSVYGKSKLMGEEAVNAYCAHALILRVSGVFSEYQTNFLKTILRLGREKTELRIVADQFTCPTSANDIAYALYTLAKSIIKKQRTYQGKYHYCSDNAVSWHQFAMAILEEAKQYQSLAVQTIHAIPSADYPTPALRPAYSVLDCSQIKIDFDLAQPSWERAVKQTVAALLSHYPT